MCDLTNFHENFFSISKCSRHLIGQIVSNYRMSDYNIRKRGEITVFEHPFTHIRLSNRIDVFKAIYSEIGVDRPIF